MILYAHTGDKADVREGRGSSVDPFGDNRMILLHPPKDDCPGL
jgi:hypothetical protein